MDFSSNAELEYASMVITRDYARLQTSSTRTTTTLLHDQQLTSTNVDENTTTTPTISVNISKNVFAIPKNL